MANTDEFEYGDDLAPGLGAKFVAACVLLVFVFAVFGTALTDAIFPVEGIQLIGAELAEQEELDAEANLWDGTLARRFEESLREHSRVRATVLPDYAFLKFAFLDEAPTGIVVGDHHWLFLEKRIGLSEWDDRFLADCFGTAMVAVERRVAGNGIELITLPLLRKAYVARDYVPRGYDPRPAVDDLLIEGLKARGLKIVDLRELYAAYRPEEIYFELDTHWTPDGARIAAEEMARVAGTLLPESERAGSLTVETLEDRGRMGVGTLESVNVDPQAVDLGLLDLRAPRASVIQFDEPLRSWLRNPKPDSPDALAGTSFSTAQRFAELLTHYSGRPVYDGAVAARPFLWTASQVMKQYADSGRLERLYIETPIAPPFIKFNQNGAYYTSAVGRMFQFAPPDKLVPLAPLSPKWVRIGMGKPRRLDRGSRTPVLVVPSGVLSHTGDGVACIQLSGEVQGGTVNLRFACDASTYLHELPPGPFEFTLPIIAQGETCVGPTVLADSDPSITMRIDRAEFVHQPVGERMVGLDVAEQGGGVVLTPRKTLRLARRAALVLKLSTESQHAVGIVVRVRTDASAAAREFRFEKTVPGGVIAIDLGAAAGESLDSIEVLAEQGRLSVQTAGMTGVE